MKWDLSIILLEYVKIRLQFIIFLSGICLSSCVCAFARPDVFQVNAAFPFRDRGHGAPSLSLLQTLSNNIHPNTETFWEKEIPPLLSILEGMKIYMNIQTSCFLCICLYKDKFLKNFFFKSHIFFLFIQLVPVSAFLLYIRLLSDCLLLFPESTAESLDKKHWNEKLLKVCLFTLWSNIIPFTL